jgi:hypothetical protein
MPKKIGPRNATQTIPESRQIPQKKDVLLDDIEDDEDEEWLKGFSMAYLGPDSRPDDAAQEQSVAYEKRHEVAQRLLYQAKTEKDIEAARSVLRPEMPDCI